MKEKEKQEGKQKRVCAWCRSTMSDGLEPATHGICPACFARELKEMLGIYEGTRPFRSPQAVAEAYLRRGVVGPGSHADALHVALATVGRVDALVSWNFKHMVNLGRIRLFNSVNLELGYGTIEIRTPKEVLAYGQDF